MFVQHFEAMLGGIFWDREVNNYPSYSLYVCVDSSVA